MLKGYAIKSFVLSGLSFIQNYINGATDIDDVVKAFAHRFGELEVMLAKLAVSLEKLGGDDLGEDIRDLIKDVAELSKIVATPLDVSPVSPNPQVELDRLRIQAATAQQQNADQLAELAERLRLSDEANAALSAQLTPSTTE